MKSFMASPSTVERKWYVVDAEGKTLGRLASEVANVLRGRDLWDARCLRNCTYMQDRSTTMQHRNRKHWTFNEV